MKPLVRNIPQAAYMPPPPRGPERFVGKRVEFAFGDVRRRVQGVVIAAKDNGVRGKGEIPDFILTVRGKTGRVLDVSMFDTYASILD